MLRTAFILPHTLHHGNLTPLKPWTYANPFSLKLPMWGPLPQQRECRSAVSVAAVCGTKVKRLENRSSSCWWCSTIPPPALSISTLSKIFQFAIWWSNQDNLTVFSVTIEHLKMFSLFKVDSRSHQVKGSGYRRSRSHSWVSVKVPATLSMNSLSQVINRWLYLQGGSHANCPGSPELSWLLYLKYRLNNLWLLIFRDGTQYCYFFVSKCICEQCIWVPQECLQNLMILK